MPFRRRTVTSFHLFFCHAYITKYLHDLLPIRCLNYETFILLADNTLRNQFMGFSSPGNKISTSWLVNFGLPCMAIFVLAQRLCGRTTFYHVYDRSSETEWKIPLLTVSTLCCEEQTLVSSHIHTRLIQQYIQSDIPQIAITCIWQFNPCESPDSTVYTELPTIVLLASCQVTADVLVSLLTSHSTTVNFRADVSAPCLCWKDAARAWSSRHLDIVLYEES